VSTSRQLWVPAGILAGLAGLATSDATAMVLTMADPPFAAVVELITRLTPEFVHERVVRVLGRADRTALFVLSFAVLVGCFAKAGADARRSRWRALLVWVVLAAIGALAVVVRSGGVSPRTLLPVAVGLFTWVLVHLALVNPLERQRHQPELVSRERRVFVVVAGVVGLTAGAIAIAGRVVGNSRRHVEQSRRLLRIDGVTRRPSPPGTSLGLEGLTPWRTPNHEFFTVHSATISPTIEPHEWRLRIHGMVDREMTLDFKDLVSREIVESWITLPCVTNEVGGDQIGNARWSGVRIADLLEEAGVVEGADCVRQTSHDGWDCATPLSALTDGRAAMLAVAMNGRPLPIEHGFPVRTIVPGLYGHVSATKWVVDLEVTRFDAVETWWTTRGWSERAAVRLASRIDLPLDGDAVDAGEVVVGGMAWHPHTGIARVEVALNGGQWLPAELGASPSGDTWVQWSRTLTVRPGEHSLRVRAVARDGEVQTGVRRGARPDGATGWHTIRFVANERS
jgi:DMSO/TMAO reductase YedYZ molybdopterin-dependent catalytic subunit